MKSEYIEEKEGWIGVKVIDNNEVEHKIAVQKSGEIRGHSQAAYPDDPDGRAEDENEHFNQARKYAKWHVLRERGYETVPPYRRPERIAAVLTAIRLCSDEEFEEYFGDFYRQIASHHQSGIDRPYNLPRGASDSRTILYTMDVFLEEGSDEILSLEEEYGRRLTEAVREEIETLSLDTLFDSPITTLSESFLGESDDSPNPPEFTIDGVSGITINYVTLLGKKKTREADSPFDQSPDGRLELQPGPLESLDDFRALVYLHLLCQIRDQYLLIGEEPPEVFRVLGPGTDLALGKYQRLDFYEDYHDVEADIPGYYSLI